MKKQIIIILLLFYSAFSWSQQFVKTTTPCNDELLKNTAGRWIHWGDPWYAKVSKQQEQEMYNRLEKIHQFVFAIYPSPFGIDVAWGRNSSDEEFAQQVRSDPLPDGSERDDFYNGIPMVAYSYTAEFHPYWCKDGEYRMLRGYPSEEAAIVQVYANFIKGFLLHDDGSREEMKIDGRKIRLMPPVKGKWKGYTLYHPEAGSGVTRVLLHREGMLPYKPVTRKQYLDLSIGYFNKWYDKMIADIDQTAKAWGIKLDPADKEKIVNQKKNVLKHYKDELEASTAAGLLDTPAIITTVMGDIDTGYPIFASETAGGKMVVTENPAYIRKELPNYIPQFFVVTFGTFPWEFTLKEDPMKLMEEKFPIEKVQAMIYK